MQITTNQFNAVAELLGTADKNLVFAVCIKTLTDAGVELRDAIDSVLGANRYDAMVGEIYDRLTA